MTHQYPLQAPGGHRLPQPMVQTAKASQTTTLKVLYARTFRVQLRSSRHRASVAGDANGCCAFRMEVLGVYGSSGSDHSSELDAEDLISQAGSSSSLECRGGPARGTACC